MASPNGRAQQRSDAMPIENRDVAVGTVLTARYRKRDRTCEVVETPDGVRYRLHARGGDTTPACAGGGARGTDWSCWSTQGTERARREPKAEKPAKSVTAKKTSVKKAKKKSGA